MSIHKYNKSANSNLTVGDTSDEVSVAEGMPRAQVNNAMRSIAGDIAKDYWDNGQIVTTGTGDAYAITTNSDITALANGLKLTFRVHADSLASATLDINGLGPKAIVFSGRATRAGDMQVDDFIPVVFYDDAWVVSTPRVSEALDFKGALIELSADKAVSSAGTGAAIIWDQTVYDTDGFFSLANPTRLTIPAGVTRVEVSSNVQFSTADGQATLFVEKGGVEVSGLPRLSVDTSGVDVINIHSTAITVSEGDYFEVLASVANLRNANANERTWFAIKAIQVSGPSATTVSSDGTGLYTGSVPTINGGDITTYDMTVGYGAITDITDPLVPVITEVTVPVVSGRTPDVTGAVVHVLSDSAGALFEQVSFPTAAQMMDNIYLCRLIMVGANIMNVVYAPHLLLNTRNALNDLSRHIGKFAISGCGVATSGADLTIDKIGGIMRAEGENAGTDRKNPDAVTIAAGTDVTFRHGTQTGTIASDVTVLDVGNYDVGGVVTAIPGSPNQATIQTVYEFPSGVLRVLYGQTIYASLSEATTAMSSYAPIAPTSYTDNGVQVTLIAVTKAATDLTTQASFLSTGSLGGGGGGAGGGGSTLPTWVSTASTAFSNIAGYTGNYVETTAGSAVTITIEPDSSVPVENGETIMFLQGGAGLVTLQTGTGVFFITAPNYTPVSLGQGALIVAIKHATDTWKISGEVVVT